MINRGSDTNHSGRNECMFMARSVAQIFSLSIALLLSAFFVSKLSATGIQATDCNRLNHQAYQAYKTKNSAKLLSFLKQAEPVCADSNYIKNLTARVLFDQIDQKKSLPLDKRIKQLNLIISIAPENTKTAWLSQEKRGDILHQQGFYEPAFRSYEKALNLIGMPTDLNKNAKAKAHLAEAPKAEEIFAIHRKAQRERLLSDTIILSSKGEKTGVELLGFKGACVTQVAFPITFDTGKSRANKRGMAYTQQLKTMLDTYNQPVITIVGHTDERNQKHRNLQLSEDRANFVKRYLEEHGYRKNSITSIGVSSKQHFDDPEYNDYPNEDRWRLDRRVEVKISPIVCQEGD